MNEENVPQVTVDDLMVKIQKEVMRQRAMNGLKHAPQTSSEGSLSPLVDWSRVDANLMLAEGHVRRGVVLPRWSRFGRIKRNLARGMARLVTYVSSFLVNQQREINIAILQSLHSLVDGVRRLDGGIQKALTQLDQGEQKLTQQEQWFSGLEHALNEVRGLATMVAEQWEQGLAARDQRLHGLEQTLSSLHEQVAQNVQEHLAPFHRFEEHQVGQNNRINELERSFLRIKTDLALQDRRVTLLLEEARKRLPMPLEQEQLRVMEDEYRHRIDALYVAFEDVFRGSKEDIKERLRIYLPILKNATTGAATLSIIDVGCGRGEWLEILREEGLVAQGVDTNRMMIEQCRLRRLAVVEGEAIAFLRTLPDTSVDAITAFHVVEHFLFEDLVRLLDEIVRVLKPGGVAIFETPNPDNVLVGSRTFFMDPTHRRPLPSPVLKFLGEARGLCRVETWNLHPYPVGFHIQGTELAQRFSELFYGPQDYAVIGYRV